MIKIYTMKNCPYCKDLKDMLNKDNINFEEVDIELDENKDEIEKVFEVSGVESVPIARVHNQLVAPDVSFSSIEEAFDIIKTIMSKHK